MSEADRIRREQALKAAMANDPNQPVPMAGYPHPSGGNVPSIFYQGTLAVGYPKAEAQKKTMEVMQEANKYAEEHPDTYRPWPTEGEY